MLAQFCDPAPHSGGVTLRRRDLPYLMAGPAALLNPGWRPARARQESANRAVRSLLRKGLITEDTRGGWLGGELRLNCSLGKARRLARGY